MKIDLNIWGNKFKVLKLENSKLHTNNLWDKLFLLNNSLLRFDDNEFKKIVCKEESKRFSQVSKNTFNCKIINSPTYKFKFREDDYFCYLKSKIIPILQQIKIRLVDLDLYFIYLDSFYKLSNEYKYIENTNPKECILSIPIIHQTYQLLISKIELMLYTLFDPSNYTLDDDANFCSLYKELSNLRKKFNDIKIVVEVDGNKIDFNYKPKWDLLIDYFKNVKNQITIFFKENMSNYILKTVKHSTTFKGEIKTIAPIDAFYIFSFAWRYLYWTMIDILLPKNSHLYWDEGQSEIVSNGDKSWLYDTIHCNNDQELDYLNNIYKQGNYFEKIKNVDLCLELSNKFNDGEHYKINFDNKYRFDTYDSKYKGTFNVDIKELLKKIIDANEIKDNKDLLYAIIEYLSHINK